MPGIVTISRVNRGCPLGTRYFFLSLFFCLFFFPLRTSRRVLVAGFV